MVIIKFLCLIYFSGWTHGNGTRLPAKDRQERGGNSIAIPVPVSKRLVIVSDFKDFIFIGTSWISGQNSGLLQ
jgi:hypothetical protein